MVTWKIVQQVCWSFRYPFLWATVFCALFTGTFGYILGVTGLILGATVTWMVFLPLVAAFLGFVVLERVTVWFGIDLDELEG